MFKETEKFIIEVKGIIENNVFEEFFKNFSSGFDAIDSFFEINYGKLKINLLSKEEISIKTLIYQIGLLSFQRLVKHI